MKTTLIICIGSVAAAMTVVVGQNIEVTQPFYKPVPTITVTWEYDKYRDELARIRREQDICDEFNKTNTNHTMCMTVEHDMMFRWSPQRGQRELGYRSDGVVVWRELPEGK